MSKRRPPDPVIDDSVPVLTDYTFVESATLKDTEPKAARRQLLAVRKDFGDVSVEPVPDSRRLTFTISTGSPDRERDVVSPEGWNLAAYRKNPVVLWGHDYHDPRAVLGKAVDIRIEGDKLISTAEFLPGTINPDAELVYQMLKAGVLRATSVGFRPLKYARNEERGGIDFTEQELLEYSVVPVPANAEALMHFDADHALIKGLFARAGVAVDVADPDPVLDTAEGAIGQADEDLDALMSEDESANLEDDLERLDAIADALEGVAEARAARIDASLAALEQD